MTAVRMGIPESIRKELERYGQLHLLRWWDELDDGRRRQLLQQITAIDFQHVQSLIDLRDASTDVSGQVARTARARPPESLVRLPASGGNSRQWADAEDCGRDLLRCGTVAAILVAGGQGTRLGFDRPKGMFPIGPLTGKSLFQLHCEQLRARARVAGCPIPYFIMTSAATHDATVAFFAEHDFFGIPSGDVYFFQQRSLPAIDDGSSRILLAAKDRLSTSPDGHGGLLDALRAARLLDVMRERGIEYLYYQQVDNPTALICDPAFLGLHVRQQSRMSTKVVPKLSAEERMGVVVSIDGHTEIIEYSDLPPELAARTDPDGRLLLWAGSTAIHVFDRCFLEQLQESENPLPYHVAHKVVPCIDDNGEPVVPESPNAHKFEQFIFDALPHADRALVVEADRAAEFNPVKNLEGTDSPETARAGLLRNARHLLAAAGFHVPDTVRVEISPLFAGTPEELRSKLPAGRRFESDIVLE